MYYAKFIRNAQDTLTVGANDGKPLNFSIGAFDTVAERQAAIDAAWNARGNGFKVTRKEVEGFYGRNFELSHHNVVVEQGAEDVLWDDALAIASHQGDGNADAIYRGLIEQHKPFWLQFA